jgi:hypothetical protein
MRQSAVLLWLCLFGCGVGCTSSNGASVDGGPGSDGAPGSTDGGDGGGVTADAGDAAVVHVDRSNLTDAGTSGPLDYSDPALWVCRPGIDPNPCYGNLDATELLADGGRQLVSHHPAPNPKFDCFYVYPTVLLTCNNCNMTDFSNLNYVLDPLISQAARFSEMCEIYAPLYRQVGFTPTASPGTDAGMDAGGGDGGAGGLFTSTQAARALQDVRDAFQYYLTHFNHGRKFVIMGHSQGTIMLAAMMKTDVDPVASVRSQMISALLIGGGTTVAPGQTAHGTFQNIPICTKPGDTGCMIAFSSYDVASPPGANALFGKSPDGNEVACTNPGPLAGNSGPYTGTYFPTKIANAAFTADNPAPTDTGTPFVLYRGLFQGSCVMKNGSYLEVTFLGASGDPRGIPPYKISGAESLGFGLHVADYNIPLEDLMNAVKQQAAAALPP